MFVKNEKQVNLSKNIVFVPMALQTPITSIAHLAVCVQCSPTVPPQTMGSIWLSDISVLFCTSCTVGLCATGQLLTLWGPVAWQGGNTDVTEVSDLSLAAGNGMSIPPKKQTCCWELGGTLSHPTSAHDLWLQMAAGLVTELKRRRPCNASTSEAIGRYLFVTNNNPKHANPVYLDAKGEGASENVDLT